MRALMLEADWDPRPNATLTDLERRTRRARMGSQVWRHPRLIDAVVADPEIGADEVLVVVRACGVCGSDTLCYETDADGYILFSGPVAAPCVLGHEYAGEVIEVGAAVRHLAVGDLVTAEGMLYCGVCEACRKGYPNQCNALDMTGFTAAGAYASAIRVREKHCWKINALAESLGDATAACEHAALIEPTACSYNGLYVSGGGMPPGCHVAVFGCGPIGLGAIALARASGAAAILAFDVSESRLALAPTAPGPGSASAPRPSRPSPGRPACCSAAPLRCTSCATRPPSRPACRCSSTAPRRSAGRAATREGAVSLRSCA